jgi:hypothetical protein
MMLDRSQFSVSGSTRIRANSAVPLGLSKTARTPIPEYTFPPSAGIGEVTPEFQSAKDLVL